MITTATLSAILLATLLATPTTSAPLSLSLACRKNSAALSALTLPPSALPPPDASWALRYVALGLGTQNYTCAGAGASAPAPAGAVAALYDASARLAGAKASAIPTLAAQALASAKPAAAGGAPALAPALGMPQLGRHYFAASGAPTFDLARARPAPALLSARKVAAVPAPGAVAWLELVDDGGGAGYGGLRAVYRVETAGGLPPASCDGLGASVAVPYAAEYWFYGV